MTPKDILTNPTFCPMPWIGLMYNFDGTVKNCIRSDQDTGSLGNIKNNSIEKILLGPVNITKQQNITNRLPAAGCHTCYNLENGKQNFDIISDRIFYIREFKKTPMDTYRMGHHELHTIDVRWTNLCNFACTYCNPRFSSRWAEELGAEQSVPTEEQRSKFKEYVLRHAPTLKHVYMAGGEPLLMKENLELLDLLNPNVNLRINTNLSKVDTRVFDRICEFKNVHWTISVETVEEEYEYIRYGGNWQDFLDNLNKIKKLDHKISFNMLHFLLNYKSVFNCVDFLKVQGFHNNSFIIGPLLTPEYLNIRHLPDAVLDTVSAELENRINAKPGFLLENSYVNMLNYIKQPMIKNLANSFAQIGIIDQRRGLDSSKIFQELYGYR
jgi:MoaA/NifB/PqqE/SkfB family radical SAM enzyme